MPSAVPYTPRVFVPDRFEPRGRLGDYARQRGQDEADAIRQGGNISAQMWSGIGQNIAGSLRDIAAIPAQRQAAALLEQKAKREEQAYQEAQAAKQTEVAKAQRLQQLVQEHQGQRVPTPILIQEFGPQDASEIDKAFDELFPVAKVPEPYTLNPGDQRRGADNAILAENPRPAPVETPPSLQRETLMVGGKRTVVNFNPKTGTYTNLQGQPVDVEPVPERTPGASGPRPLTQTAEAQIINRLNTQWNAAAKPVKDLERQVALMDTGMEAVNRGDMAQGAQMVLVTFQKILDPPSVVRESEFMRSAAGQSLMNRVKGAMERLAIGGAGVRASELQKFAELAREAAQAQRKASGLDSTKKRLGLTADRYGIPQELIFDVSGDVPAAPAEVVEEWGFDANGQLVRKPKGGG